MKKKIFILLLLVCITIVSFSQAKVNEKDSAAKKAPDPKDRNMFGIGIPRGLTITSDGLTDGYVMFDIRNSGGMNYSTIYEISIPTDKKGTYFLEKNLTCVS